MPDGIVSSHLARQLAEGPMLDGMPAADLYRDTYAEGPMLDGMSQDELFRQSVPRANPYAEGPMMDGLEAERLFRQSRPMGGPEEGPLLDGFDARRLFQESPQRVPVQMTPSRGYTLGEAALGGAQLGARGGSVMGAGVRGMGAGNEMELQRLNREFMTDRARRRAYRGLGGTSMEEVGPLLASHLTEEGRMRGGAGRYIPYGADLPRQSNGLTRFGLGAEAYDRMEPVTLRDGSKVSVDHTDLETPGWQRFREESLARNASLQPVTPGGTQVSGGWGRSGGSDPSSVLSTPSGNGLRYDEEDLRDLFYRSEDLKARSLNPQYYGYQAPGGDSSDYLLDRSGPVSDIDLQRSGISREFLEYDQPTAWVSQRNAESLQGALSDRALNDLPEDRIDSWESYRPEAYRRPPSRMSRFGSALKTGVRGALSPANIVKDAIGGSIVGGLSAGAGHLTGRPTSAGQLSLPQGSPLLGAAGDGPVDQATMLRIIEAAAQRKEAKRAQLINEVNKRYGRNTLGPGARLDEIADYLGPVAPINR